MILKADEINCVKSVRIRSYSGPHFPAFSLRIQREYEKMQTRITPNKNTFHAVIFKEKLTGGLKMT